MTICGYVYRNPNRGYCPVWSTFTQNCDMCGVLNWESVCITCGTTTTTTSTSTSTTTTAPTTTTTSTTTTTTTTIPPTTTTTTSTSTTTTTSTSTTSTSTTTTSSTTTTTTTRIVPLNIQVYNEGAFMRFGNSFSIWPAFGSNYYYSGSYAFTALATGILYSGPLLASTIQFSLQNPGANYNVKVEYSSNGGISWTTLTPTFTLLTSVTFATSYATPNTGAACILKITVK